MQTCFVFRQANHQQQKKEKNRACTHTCVSKQTQKGFAAQNRQEEERENEKKKRRRVLKTHAHKKNRSSSLLPHSSVSHFFSFFFLARLRANECVCVCVCVEISKGRRKKEKRKRKSLQRSHCFSSLNGVLFYYLFQRCSLLATHRRNLFAPAASKRTSTHIQTHKEGSTSRFKRRSEEKRKR